jgi:hypothetical protein
MTPESKEPTPVLVAKDGERKPVASTMTRDELLDIVKAIVTSQRTAEDIATKVAGEVAAQVAADVFDRMEGKNQYGDWNVKNYHERSTFNPKGDHPELGHPRPEIDGIVFWVGTPMQAKEMTHEEIALTNALKPGRFHGGAWRVVDLAPGQVGTRALLVLFPCTEPDQRAALPDMVTMLKEMTAAPVAVAS